ncbi:TIGR04222 domain-containing membrane protein [Streptomyces sp. NPDC048106]|uniref:TIGR04222 domain-containing membrane protein n=1 Tax=Streptomyces sp. NPDC048106 TaxID=3155750 RepID=UPI003452B91A
MRTRRRRSGTGEAHAAPAPTLAEYDIAFLAGGVPRVADSAVVALSARGLITVRAGRIRVVRGGALPGCPVERAVVEYCGVGSRSVAQVRAAVQRASCTQELAQRLVTAGLVGSARHRVTRAGRRRLKEAERAGTLPDHVFRGAGVFPDGPLRRTMEAVPPAPSGLGRTLIRLGRALDREDDHHHGTGHGHGSGHHHDHGGHGHHTGSDSSSHSCGFGCGGGGY